MTANVLRKTRWFLQIATLCVLPMTANAHDADKELLDTLLGNGAITQQQYDRLMRKDAHAQPTPAPADKQVSDKEVLVEKAPAKKPNELKASYASSGYRLETAGGKWQTNLQWRAQLRYTNPTTGDPRSVSAFNAPSRSTIEARRLRMRIGGHGFEPWLKYYFDVDLQLTRDVDDAPTTTSARVFDFRIDIAKWDWGGVRIGQWKIDYNRERVDSSAHQQFVERSIVNRVFNVDRQIGIQLRGHAFDKTLADTRWYLGAYTGEGRGVRNADNDMMLVGRLQWNFLGRDLPLRQTDVEYTELPTAAIAFGASTARGPCTRWSSDGCGNLDGFDSPDEALIDQFEVDQWVQDFAYKYRGLSIQQEYHRKTVTDTLRGTQTDMTGGFIQSGYFFHYLYPAVPRPLEFALRYAWVDEPSAQDRRLSDEREELSLAANWFFNGHRNKLTLDFSHLTLDDAFANLNESRNRLRLQWDVSF